MFTLIVLVYAGVFAKGDSVALYPVMEFKTQAACVAAGEQLKPLVAGTAKELHFVCLKKD